MEVSKHPSSVEPVSLQSSVIVLHNSFNGRDAPHLSIIITVQTLGSQ